MENRQRELAKNTIILTVGKICTQFISFMLLPLYTTLLRPEEYGMVDLLNTYIMLLVPLFNWQFQNGLFRFMVDCRKDEKQQKKLFTTIFTVNIVQIILYLCFYFIVRQFISTEYKFFLAIDVVLNIILNTLLQFPRGIGNNTAYAIASFISASSNVLLNVLFIAVLRWGAYGMFMATVCAKIITIIYICFNQKIWRYYNLKLFNGSILKEVLVYSLPLVPNELSWWIVGVSDRLLVSKFISIAANGIYSIANKFSSIFITFYNIFSMSWAESVSLHIEDEDCDDFLTDIINSMFSLFAAICLGAIACMPFVFSFIVNEQYNEAYYHVPILMISILFQVVVGLYSAVYVALKKTTDIAKTSFYAAIINVIVNVVFIRWIGLYAASLSTLAAYITMAFYRYFDVKKYVNVRLKRSTMLVTVGIGILLLFSYYYNHLLTNSIALVITLVYAVYFNKSFLISTIKIVLEKRKVKLNR